ncbi:MAG: DegT/DnrJ/EryC1/StrS family aminotransferase [Mariprofundaceae bacterium]|nr:DegT/DnrJ/EryC1/StrS family aminotransferase [Mariprofundaceae bacterium]
MKHIPHASPAFGSAFQQAAADVLDSGILAQGKQSQQLELAIAAYFKRDFVLAVDSGTSALMLSIRALLKHQQGRVGIPAYACASLLFAVKAAGATPVFMDCDAALCLDQEQAWKVIPSLDVLVLVHPFGLVEPMVGQAFPCPVIEDVAQSVGATWQQRKVGTWTDICVGSCYATKPWGGAYGGFVVTDDQHLNAKISAMTDPDHADLQQPYVGHHQLSNMHAALAVTRLQEADKNIDKRHILAEKYDGWLKNSPNQRISAHHEAQSNHFRYVIRCQATAELALEQLQALGIGARRPVQIPLHHSQPSKLCPQADLAWQHCISLPMLTDLDEESLQHLEQGIQQCL